MYRNYIKKTLLVYFIIGINLGVQLAINFIVYLFDKKSSGLHFYAIHSSDYVTGFLMLLSIMFIALAFTQGIVLIASVFNLDHFFGKDNKKSIQDIIKFTVFHAFMLSVIINSLILILQYFTGINLPIVMNLNWATFSALPQKVILFSLILITFYGLGLWIGAGFKKDGVFIGLARIAIVITYLVQHGFYYSNYYMWGQEAFINIGIFIIIALITYTHTYMNMIHYERR